MGRCKNSCASRRKNQGYGRSVNNAVARCEADLVLVLNSDTEIRENFLPKLCQALQEDDKLAVISPIHDAFFVMKRVDINVKPVDILRPIDFKVMVF